MRTIRFHSLSLGAIAVLMLAGNVAAQDKPSGLLNSLEVRELVARAESSDHVRLIGRFTVLADRYAAEAKRHVSMSQSFIGNPSRVHHDRLAGLSRDAAKEVSAAAKMHKGLAGVAR